MYIWKHSWKNNGLHLNIPLQEKKQFAKGVLRFLSLSIEDLLVQKLNMTKL